MNTAAQVAEVLQSLQASAALHGKVCQGRCQQVTERLAVASTYATSHLVQVGESKVVGTIDNNSIRIRNIDTVLHDGGRKQHVIVVVDEVKDNLLQFFRFHLSMTNGNTHVRNIFFYHLLQALQVVDARIDEIHLTITRHFEINGISYYLWSEGVNLSLDGIAVGRRCLDDTEVTGSH